MEKKKISSFFITINTNYSIKQYQQHYINCFYDACTDMIDGKNDCIDGNNDFFMYLKNKKGKPIEKRKITKIDANISIEISPKAGKLHAHILMNITHNDFVQINTLFITNKFCYYLQNNNFLKNNDSIFPYKVYTNVIHKKNTYDDIKIMEYMKKKK